MKACTWTSARVWVFGETQCSPADQFTFLFDFTHRAHTLALPVSASQHSRKPQQLCRPSDFSVFAANAHRDAQVRARGGAEGARGREKAREEVKRAKKGRGRTKHRDAHTHTHPHRRRDNAPAPRTDLTQWNCATFGRCFVSFFWPSNLSSVDACWFWLSLIMALLLLLMRRLHAPRCTNTSLCATLSACVCVCACKGCARVCIW